MSVTVVTVGKCLAQSSRSLQDMDVNEILEEDF